VVTRAPRTFRWISGACHPGGGRHRRAGTFWSYLLVYGLSRFVIEFFRGDRGRGLYFGDAVSLSQIISIVLVPLSLAMLWWLSRQPTPTRDMATSRKVA
jgi:prolipoprotein diacylglyceryltransferase